MPLPHCAHVDVECKTRRPWRGERTIVVESPSAPKDVLLESAYVVEEPLSAYVVEEPLSAQAAVLVAVAELVVVRSDDLFRMLVVMTFQEAVVSEAEEPVVLAYFSCRKNKPVLFLLQALRRDPPVVLEFSVPRISLLLLLPLQELT